MWELKLKKSGSRQTVYYNLKNIKGLNDHLINEILISCGLSKNSYMENMKQRHINLLYNKLTELRKNKLIDDLLEEENKKRYKEILKLNNWRSLRHIKRYPQKGRTRSNGQSRKKWRMR